MEVGASSSSSPTRRKTEYDVFISFRGEDTRYAFTAHLFEALRIRKVHTYLDEVTLKRGDEISPALLQAIQQSKISVIVFSENYADSSWCLDELVRIMECKEIHGQQVVPIFYHVDPSCVRNQKGPYELEERFKDKKMEKLEIHGQAWRNALTKAANLSGWSTHQIRSEPQWMKIIVEDIIKRLRSMSSSSASLKELAGIQRRMNQVESMLCPNSSSDRVIVVGLWGMGGIGKTTLARAVFDKISHHFEGCCFLSNVREKWDNGRNKYDLQNKLFWELLDEETNNTKMMSSFDKNRLHSKKVLIVLDDANDPEQLEFLAGDGKWFELGSRIIVTTRDVQLLKNRVDHEIYKVEELSFDEAFQHFQKIASTRNIPIGEFTELSRRAVEYAGGIPLVLQVLMGSLFRDNNKGRWESVLDDLKDSPNEKIHNVLKISYDGLPKKEKDVFLDIACFFKGGERSNVERILKGSDSFVGMRIDNLVDKSLIAIEKHMDWDSLWMHDSVQEMCWEIVNQQSINKPGKRSRLWKPEDVYHVFKNNKVSAEVEGIFLDISKIKTFNLSPNVFLEANNLRLLKIHSSNRINNTKLCFPQGLQSLPDALRLLSWEGCPLKTFPLSFDPIKLVQLRMPKSQVEQLWDGIQHLPNLKIMDLSDSKNLTCIPDLSQAPNLQRIVLDNCINLLPVTSHFQNLEKLIHLYMNYCVKQTSAPNLRPSIEILELNGCQNLKNIPEIKGNMAELDLRETSIEELPSSIGSLDQLQVIRLEDCQGLKSLPASISQWQYLTRLFLSGCSSLENLPDLPKTIDTLKLCGTSIDQLPTSIESLPFLRSIYLKNCKRLQSLPTHIYKLKGLHSLDLSGCSKIDHFPDILEPMEKLVYLNLSGTAIKELPTSVKNLPNLEMLGLGRCENLQFLPLSELPLRLNVLNAQGCTSLERLSPSRIELTKLNVRHSFLMTHIISFFNCLKLDHNTRNIILAYGQLRILQNASLKLRDPDRCVCICYPGNEIPVWFNYIADCSEVVPLPSNWLNSNFLGFALSFVAEFEEYYYSSEGLRFLIQFQVTTKSGECHKYSIFKKIVHRCVDEKECLLSSDHVFMLYESDSFYACKDIEEADNITGVSFSICPVGVDKVTPIQSCQVKTCGFRLLYLEEAREFGLLDDDDDDDDDKCKRRRIR
ncbi:disease resistance protein RPV1-like [Humulus lupulus]|uniref:disease resistance protein RPV1-like n=1 Tax=Humulus lupulus TaxID=3486 RepID=UPI002B403B0B|nr:disease resistance protein RPV1-like [Humulus lupulus]